MKMVIWLDKKLEVFWLFKQTAKFIIALFFALSIFSIYLLFTLSGTQLVINFACKAFDQQISYSQIKGNLIHGIELQDLKLKNHQWDLKAKQVNLRWYFFDLLKIEKKIQSVFADSLTVTFKNRLEDSSSNTFLTLKKHLNVPFLIEDISLLNIFIQWPKNHHIVKILEVKNVSLSSLNMQTIQYQGDYGTLHAELIHGIKAQWDLCLANNPFLKPYFKGQVKTKGNIFLPKKKITDPLNQLKVNLQAEEAHFKTTTVKQLSLNIHGTLSSHFTTITGVLDNCPFHSDIEGSFIPKEYKGIVRSFALKHSQWEKIGNTKGNIKIKWDKKNIYSFLNLELSNKYPILAEFSINKKQPYKVKGTLNADNSVQILSPFFPLHKAQGKLLLDLKYEGYLPQLEYLGNISVKDANIPLPFLSVPASLNKLEILLNKDIAKIKGEGILGKGLYSLDGSGNLKEASLSFKLQGEKLLLSDSKEYTIVGSPDLTVTLAQEKAHINGTIFIPEAKIQSSNSSLNTTLSSDVTISSKALAKTAPPHSIFSKVTSDIDLILGDNISYKGNGLTSNIKGKLRIKNAAHSPVAFGKLILQNGKYRAYGKKFEINYGQILFSGGPLDNPTIEIQAQRKIQPQLTAIESQPISVGIQFSGNVKSPKITFFSTPTMPETDIISYLVVGQPQHRINQAQAELLFDAISQLTHISGKSREDVQFDLAEKFKLDQLGLIKKSTLKNPHGIHPLEDTMLTLGKQLSEKLYLNYSVGILDSANTLGLRYLLGKNLTLEASTGTAGSSADLLLSFEGH